MVVVAERARTNDLFDRAQQIVIVVAAGERSGLHASAVKRADHHVSIAERTSGESSLDRPLLVFDLTMLLNGGSCASNPPLPRTTAELSRGTTHDNDEESRPEAALLFC